MDTTVKDKSVKLGELQVHSQKLFNKGIISEGTCSTAAATAAKEVTLGTTFELVTGATLIVKFTNAISVASATLAVTHTDLDGTTTTETAKPIYYRGAALAKNLVAAGDRLILRYNGTQYDIMGHLDTNTDTKVTKVSYHYTPAADSGSELSASATGGTAAWNIDVVQGVQIQRDAKGHVTGVTVTSGKTPANPLPANTVTGSGLKADKIVLGNGNSAVKTSSKGITTTNPSANSTDDDLPTSKAVWGAIADGIAANDAMVYKGTIAGGSTGSYGALTAAANRGWTYKVSKAGKIDGIAVEVGDMIICNTDSTAAATSSNYSTIAAKWDYIQANADGVLFKSSNTFTDGHVLVADSTAGKVKDSGFTIGKSVPANAVFTDNNTTYKLKIGSNWNGDTTNGTSLGELESKTAAASGTALSLVTTGEKATWNAKQDAISNLSTIESNASTGATHAGTTHAPSDANKFDLSYASSKLTKSIDGTSTDVVTASTIVTDGGGLKSHQTIKQDGVTGATVNRFGTCSVAAATAAKTVSITTGTFSLEAGAKVSVKFTNANTASSPTLNVNSKGAKNIFHKGAQITTGDNKALLAGVCDFIYDGTQWHLVGSYIDTNTHNSHALTLTNGTATAVNQGTEITYVESVAGCTATSGDLTASTTRKKITVPAIPSVFSSSANGLAPAASNANKTTAETAQSNYYLCADAKFRPLPTTAFSDNNTTYKININGTDTGGGTTSLGTVYAPTSAGTQGQMLIANANGVPAWGSKPSYTLAEVGASMSASAISANTSSSCSITGSGNAGKSETIIYTNSGSSDLTVTVPTTYSTPDGKAIELTCPAGGYCEVNYINIGGTIYARGL